MMMMLMMMMMMMMMMRWWVPLSDTTLADNGEIIVISSAHPGHPLLFARHETSVREILKEEVLRMQVRPEGTAVADVSVVSTPSRAVASEGTAASV